MEYVVVTPMRNEEEQVDGLVRSVLDQAQRPLQWLIVNDGSTDNSRARLEELVAEHRDWVSIVDRPSAGDYDWLGYGLVVRYGLARLDVSIAGHQHAVGVLDADLRPSPNYFHVLLSALEQHPTLAVVSGVVLDAGEPGLREPTEYGDVEVCPGFPRGSPRLYRPGCLEAIGGFPVSPSPDTVSDILLTSRGWSVGRVASLSATSTRPTMARGGLYVANRAFGRGRFILGMPPLAAVASACAVGWGRSSAMAALGFLVGYCQGLCGRDERVGIPEVEEYFESTLVRGMRRFLDPGQ